MVLGGEALEEVPSDQLAWALGSVCALHRLPFAAELLAREFPPPSTRATIILAGRALGLRIKAIRLDLKAIGNQVFPMLVGLRATGAREPTAAQPALGILTAAAEGRVVLFKAGTNTPLTLTHVEFGALHDGTAWLCAPQAEAARDPDAVAAGAAGTTRRFGFRWFVPELLKHRRVWRDVLLASAALQLVALATPLFTQAIIDKVIVHRTQSTLIAIGVAMAVFMLFTSLLTWVRHYLVLHTGNRVDAVLGAAVWEHLLKLPVRYFEHRPTGVVAARLQGVRRFVNSSPAPPSHSCSTCRSC